LGGALKQSLKQLRAAILVVREILLELLDRGETRAVLKGCEQVFALAESRHGLAVFREHQIDVFGAVLCDPGMPAKYLSERYPRMKAVLEDRRTRKA